MSHRSFRFLHTSDFRLDAVPRGLTEVPDQLRDTLLDAPLNAARRVFDAALTERVAFVILAGNVWQPDLAGPRGTAFLAEQFQRLADAGIAIYWAGGETDPPETWPPAFPLPENVRVFAKDRVTDFLHQEDGSPLARIVGTSRGSRAINFREFLPDAVGLFSIGVACEEVDAAELLARNEDGEGYRKKGDGLEAHPTESDRLKTYPTENDRLETYPTRGMNYWALGGRAERSTLFNSPGIAHYPGTPQGRSPAETGAHGCTLVQVDEQGRPRMTFVAINALEWSQETLLVDPSMRREGLEAMLAQRIHGMAAGAKADLLVTWKVVVGGPLAAELRRGKLRGELLERLRIEHGSSSPKVWAVDIEVEPRDALPESLYEQETIMGDFLRTLREFDLDPEKPLNVESLLADEQAAGSFSQAVAIADPATRKRVLHEAALLGMELLGGETNS